MCYGGLQTPGQGTGQSQGVPRTVGGLRAGEDGLPGKLPGLGREGPVCAWEDRTLPGSSHTSAITRGPSLQKGVAQWWDVPPKLNVAWSHPKNISKQNMDRVRWLQVTDGLSDKTQHTSKACDPTQHPRTDEPLPGRRRVGKRPHQTWEEGHEQDWSHISDRALPREPSNLAVGVGNPK